MPDAATYHGRTGVRTLFTTLLEVFDDVQYEVEEIIERGDHSVVVLTQLVHGRGSGINMNARTVHAWEMHEGRPSLAEHLRDARTGAGVAGPGLRPR